MEEALKVGMEEENKEMCVSRGANSTAVCLEVLC